MGYFEFRLCQNNEKMKKVKQNCFDKNLLLIYDNNENTLPTDKMRALNTDMNRYKYFLPHKNNTFFYVRVQLPSNVVCKYCILQWRYHAGNNFGKADKDDVVCLGCSAKQEEFYNCADIAIIPDVNKKYMIDDSNSANSTLTPISSLSFKLSYDFSLIFFLIHFYFNFFF
jgi:hypothetical protein